MVISMNLFRFQQLENFQRRSSRFMGSSIRPQFDWTNQICRIGISAGPLARRKKHMRKTVLILMVIIFCQSEAQLVKSYGFKVGLAAESQKWEFAAITTLAVDTKIRTGIDVGVFIEWLDIPYFSVLTELHYIQKGAKCTSNVMWTIVDRNSPQGYVDQGYYSFTPRLDYLSIPLLVKFRFATPVCSAYLVVGPRIDFFLSRHGTDWLVMTNDYQKINFGGTYGIGLEQFSLVPFNIGAEFRYSPSYQKSYTANNLTVNNQSMEFLLLIGL